MNEKLANAIKAQANEARLNKKMVLKDLKQLMEGLIQQIEDDRIWISDLKSLQSNLNLAVAQMTSASFTSGATSGAGFTFLSILNSLWVVG